MGSDVSDGIDDFASKWGMTRPDRCNSRLRESAGDYHDSRTGSGHAVAIDDLRQLSSVTPPRQQAHGNDGDGDNSAAKLERYAMREAGWPSRFKPGRQAYRDCLVIFGRPRTSSALESLARMNDFRAAKPLEQVCGEHPKMWHRGRGTQIASS